MIELKLFRCLSDAVPQGVQNFSSLNGRKFLVSPTHFSTCLHICSSSQFLVPFPIQSSIFVCFHHFLSSWFLQNLLELITFLHCYDIKKGKKIWERKARRRRVIKFNKTSFFRWELLYPKCLSSSNLICTFIIDYSDTSISAIKKLLLKYNWYNLGLYLEIINYCENVLNKVKTKGIHTLWKEIWQVKFSVILRVACVLNSC